jgi:hypothetical protein
MRGRNRRGPNPLTRSYESNGPDMKVRGTAQHIAEKYTQLARDAHVSGDPVMAESYLQHAEHYYRLIAAAHQAQIAAQNGTADDNDDDDDFDTGSDRFTFRSVQQQPQQGGAPGFAGSQPGEEGEAGDGEEAAPQQERRPQQQDRPYQDRNNNRNDRNDRHNNRNRDRNQDRGFRPGGERQAERPAFNADRASPDRSVDRGSDRPAERPRRPQQDLEGAEQPVLPAFLTAPTRIVPIDVPETAPVAAGEGEVVASQFRTRRRRRPREDGDGAPADIVTSDQD